MNKEFLSTMENSRDYTYAIAEAMPERLYNSAPAGAAWGFGELLNHIAYGIQWWQENYIRGNKIDWAPPATRNSKEEVITNLKKAYDEFHQHLTNANLKGEAIKGFHATLDHVTHHRGQAVVYLRCQGITPPEYTY